jgi:DNA invertase Pin-like site-specific DNA recombinase
MVDESNGSEYVAALCHMREGWLVDYDSTRFIATNEDEAKQEAAKWAAGAIGMLSVFADFERSIIQERVRAGLLRARKEGKRLGRPRSRMSSSNVVAALKAPRRTEGVRKIAQRFGVNASTVQTISREIAVG